VGRHVVTRSISAIGTTAIVAVTDPGAAELAEALLAQELRMLDDACSRFRPDSEIHALYRCAGSPVVVSDLLFEVVRVACDVAADTGGAVDPTIGSALEALGYDRDFALLGDDDRPVVTPATPAPGWKTIDLDATHRTICVPPAVRIDVGSSAKALAADRAATRIADRSGIGVLVSVGGDIATAGPPPALGWSVGIARNSSASVDDVDQVIALQGALASSSPGVRTWTGGGCRRHHIVDPRTGDCVPRYWDLVSVAAPTCVQANALSTAAVVWGVRALPPLVDRGRPARLVRHDGEVIALNGWPVEDMSAPVAEMVASR
jgi:FAD:protein FMN transferase